MNRSDYLFMDESWAEKRSFLYPLNSTDSDGNAWHFADDVLAAIERVKPVKPSPQPDHRVSLDQNEFSCGFFNVTFNTTDGSIVGLVDVSGRQWASPSNVIGAFRYQTFTLDDFNTFNAEYNLPCEEPCGNFIQCMVCHTAIANPCASFLLRRLLQGGHGLC
jgi:hypothetical protein